MSNGHGTYRSTTANHMKAFDNLPPRARRAMANAYYDWATQPFMTLWKRYRNRRDGEIELADYITETDLGTVGKNVYKFYGPDHPQAVIPPGRAQRRKWGRS